MDENRGQFCNQPIGPWIAGVALICVMLVFWVMMKREDIIQGVEMEKERVPKVTSPITGEPSFPKAVTQAAVNSPQSAGAYALAGIHK